VGEIVATRPSAPSVSDSMIRVHELHSCNATGINTEGAKGKMLCQQSLLLQAKEPLADTSTAAPNDGLIWSRTAQLGPSDGSQTCQASDGKDLIPSATAADGVLPLLQRELRALRDERDMLLQRVNALQSSAARQVRLNI
jgi:hypothetical protein